MIRVKEIVLERIETAVGDVGIDNRGVMSDKALEATGFTKRFVVGEGVSMFDLSMAAASKIPRDELSEIGGVVAATFSNTERFPPLSVRIAGALGLPEGTPAFDLQMACSAYPYALYVAGRLAADTGRRVLVVDGDVQSPLVDSGDEATAPLFSDAATASVVSVPEASARSRVAFFSRADDALVCPSDGPVRMDGFKVFSFVATDVAAFLRPFGTSFDWFVPHQANLYMVRRLAKTLGLEDRLLCDGSRGNPGSASIPCVLARHGRPGRALLAGFGAGLSAAAATVRLADGFKGVYDA
jgi:3-oxoacyl-[acyl-carrier-protein] synthase-3